MGNRLIVFPHIITGLNIFCGFQALIYTLQSNYVSAAWLIILAGIFDVLDGKIARLLKSTSTLGIELDSMADIISFGVAPAILFYSVYNEYSSSNSFLWIIPFAYLIAGITRLVRFNIRSYQKKDQSKKDNFSGLPIPAAAFAVCSFIIFTNDYYGQFSHPDLYLILVLLVSILMVSTIEYQSFPKMSFSRWTDRINVILLGISLTLVAVNPRRMFFLLTIVYLIYNPAKNFVVSLIRSRKTS